MKRKKHALLSLALVLALLLSLAAPTLAAAQLGAAAVGSTSETPQETPAEEPATPDEPAVQKDILPPQTQAETDTEGFTKGTEEGSDYWWKFDEATGTLTVKGTKMADWLGTNQTLVPWANVKDSIRSVVIEQGMTNVGSFAFSQCSGLTSVTLPAGMTTVGPSAFQGCSGLTSLTLPESLTGIGDNAFANCTGLKGSLTIPDGVINIGWGAFYDCCNLASITLPANLAYIGEAAFCWCSALTGTLELPLHVTDVGRRAFYGCGKLTNVTIPGSVTSIGSDAFSYCANLEKIEVAKENDCYCVEDGILYDKAQTEIISVPQKISGAVTLSASLKGIGDGAFQGCAALAGITISDSVTDIAGNAFYGCYALQKILFEGDAPQIAANSFASVSATAYYPQGNATWTEAVRQNYGGTLTWVAYDPANPPTMGSDDVTVEDGGSGYVIDEEKTLSGVKPETTIDSLKSNLKDGETLVVKDAKGEVIDASKPGTLIGTGWTVGYGADGETGKVTVMIAGDIDGNGRISLDDVVRIRQSILRVSGLEGVFLRAAKPVSEGKGELPALDDVTRVRQYLLRIVDSVA